MTSMYFLFFILGIVATVGVAVVGVAIVERRECKRLGLYRYARRR